MTTLGLDLTLIESAIERINKLAVSLSGQNKDQERRIKQLEKRISKYESERHENMSDYDRAVWNQRHEADRMRAKG